MRAFFISLLVLLVLGACKRNETGQLPAPSGEPIKAQKQEVKGFALASIYPDQHDGDLAIALEFSRPLVGSQNFDELLAVTDDKGAAVKGSWVLDEKGLILRFPYVEAAKDYEVLVRADLLAADGNRLGQELKEKIHTGELDPAVGFASQGSVLPARESRGLPVVSINVKEVDVEFLRVTEKNLPRFFSEYQRGGRRGSWDLDSEYGDNTPLGDLAEPVYVNRFLLGGKPNERLLTYLPTQDIKELQQPGLYFAVMKRTGKFSGDFETAFFTVSDIGLHARAYKDKLFVHTA
ncbi:MAG: alpha-2-macroglobulin family protein, partial [Pseudoxanthomonas sp.]